MRLMRPAFSSTPSPTPSTPQLFETTDRLARTLREHGVDEHRRDAAQTEAPDRERRAVPHVGDRRGGVRHHLVHVRLLVVE